MRKKALKHLWLLMAALVAGLAMTLPAFAPSPLSTPKLTACNDTILDPKVCKEQKRTTVYCCINNLENECTEVRWWVHIYNGTDYFRTAEGTICVGKDLPCSPTYGTCK
jgi:hypothetical protein